MSLRTKLAVAGLVGCLSCATNRSFEFPAYYDIPSGVDANSALHMLADTLEHYRVNINSRLVPFNENPMRNIRYQRDDVSDILEAIRTCRPAVIQEMSVADRESVLYITLQFMRFASDYANSPPRGVWDKYDWVGAEWSFINTLESAKKCADNKD